MLHAYDWSESSLILDLFTREEGRQAAVAKGAKRPYSQLRAVLLPFQCVNLQLSRARTEAGEEEVRTLRSAEWASGSAVLPSSALLGAYYLNELLMKFLPRGAAQPSLFDAYAQTLLALCGGESEQPAVLRAFELVLLHELGLLPDLAQETLAGAVLQAQRRYTLQAELGLVPAAAEEDALDGQEWIALQAALLSGHLAALQAACQGPRTALRLQLRAVLAYHLGGAPLRTRDLMHSLRRLGAVPQPGAAP